MLQAARWLNDKQLVCSLSNISNKPPQISDKYVDKCTLVQRNLHKTMNDGQKKISAAKKI